jgi:hypothetical protein
MQTKHTLVVAVGAALLALLTLSPKAVDMDNPPLLIQPPPQDTNCYPASVTTNCEAGSFTLVITNYTPFLCIGSAASASADPTNTPWRIVITTTYTNSTGGSTPNCPPTYVTNEVSTALGPGWWVATGPGNFTAGGNGLTASFTPTNTGEGEIWFHQQYMNPVPCVTVSTTSQHTSFYVCAGSTSNCSVEPSLEVISQIVRFRHCTISA